MTQRSYNFKAKGKRLQQLALAVLMSISALSVKLIIDYANSGVNTWAEVFANNPNIIIISALLVLKSIIGELLNKRKPPQIRAMLAGVCGFYVVIAFLAFFGLKTQTISSLDEFYRTANIVYNFMIFGVGLSVACILSGKS
ncbi:MAG: hypothetical protein AAF579_22605 [Cyanobacteria bacterium P01_C01_bin.118]